MIVKRATHLLKFVSNKDLVYFSVAYGFFIIEI